jgi:hypothetical protein
VKLVVERDDARGVLASVLEHDQAVVEILNRITVAGNGNNATHGEVRKGRKGRKGRKDRKVFSLFSNQVRGRRERERWNRKVPLSQKK